MGVIKNFLDYSKRISLEHNTWQIAIRPKSETPLYKGNGKGFLIVPNSNRYWRADPFVFKHNGKNYIFAEMFDRKTNKGVIGVAKIKGNKCSRFKVCLDLNCHLSYPCVYENENGIFMLPECSASGEAAVYKCTKFPLKWTKEETIIDCPVVDTTPFLMRKTNPLHF
jgi:hypothetical protein